MGNDKTQSDPAFYGDNWADVYDEAFQARVPDEAQLSLLAELAGDGTALELGIGTGRVALPLRARGVSVAGVDASSAMVDRLKAKPGGDEIPVKIGDMADLPDGGPYRLVYVVFNTLFGLLTQDAQVACFRGVARLLDQQGSFCVECFVPDLDRFDRDQTVRAAAVETDGVQLEVSRHDPVAQVVTSQVVSITDETIALRPVKVRYSWPAELDLMAQLAGLELLDRWGSWDRTPFTDASANHVSVYTRS